MTVLKIRTEMKLQTKIIVLFHYSQNKTKLLVGAVMFIKRMISKSK